MFATRLKAGLKDFTRLRRQLTQSQLPLRKTLPQWRRCYSGYKVTANELLSTCPDTDSEDDIGLYQLGRVNIGGNNFLFIPVGISEDALAGLTRDYSQRTYGPPDFTLLMDHGMQLTNKPLAVRRGTPEEKKDIWIVPENNWETADEVEDPLENPLKDPHHVIQSSVYQRHMKQLIYATSTVVFSKQQKRKGEQEKDIDDVTLMEMPTKNSLEQEDAYLNLDDEMQELVANQVIHCTDIQEGVVQDWRDSSGREALKALMLKAELVCTVVGARVLGVKHVPRGRHFCLQNAGGDVSHDKGCTVAWAASATPISQIPEVRKEELKIEEVWDDLDYQKHRYTPDFVYSKGLKSPSYITGEVKYDQRRSNVTARGFQQMWKQALIGLKNKDRTVAVYVSAKEAGILTIQVEGDKLNTSRRVYKIGVGNESIKKGEQVVIPEQMQLFFQDLVLTIWNHVYLE